MSDNDERNINRDSGNFPTFSVNDSVDSQSVRLIIKSTVSLMFTHKMKYLNLLLGWTGTTIAFSSGMLIPIMVNQLGEGGDIYYKESLAL